MTRAAGTPVGHDAGAPRLLLLVLPILLHLAVVLLLHGAGSRHLLPPPFEQGADNELLADDSAYHLREARDLAVRLRQHGVSCWLQAPAPLHEKLYSLPLFVLGPHLGYGVLAAEPLNLLYYLLILQLLYRLGKEVFSARSGLLAAGAAAVWPSFLLHSTQFLRDPLFIAMMLAEVLLNVSWLTRRHGKRGPLFGALGALLCVILWHVRWELGEFIFAITLLGAALLLLGQPQDNDLPGAPPQGGPQEACFRGAWMGNWLGVACLLFGICWTSSVLGVLSPGAAVARPSAAMAISPTTTADPRATADPTATAGPAATSNPAGVLDRGSKGASFLDGVFSRPIRLRGQFVRRYQGAGSNVDSHVLFSTAADVVRYLPRALTLGTLAPFPAAWLGPGRRVSQGGKLLIGVEMLVLYPIEALALYGLWRSRRRPAVWLLAGVALMGSTALGLIVVNMGALYRLRYVFSMLLFVPAARGALLLTRGCEQGCEGTER